MGIDSVEEFVQECNRLLASLTSEERDSAADVIESSKHEMLKLGAPLQIELSKCEQAR